jgi:hypothetical protein
MCKRELLTCRASRRMPKCRDRADLAERHVPALVQLSDRERRAHQVAQGPQAQLIGRRLERCRRSRLMKPHAPSVRGAIAAAARWLFVRLRCRLVMDYARASGGTCSARSRFCPGCHVPVRAWWQNQKRVLSRHTLDRPPASLRSRTHTKWPRGRSVHLVILHVSGKTPVVFWAQPQWPAGPARRTHAGRWGVSRVLYNVAVLSVVNNPRNHALPSPVSEHRSGTLKPCKS